MFELDKDQLRTLTLAEIDAVGGADNDKTSMTTLTSMTIMTTSSPVCTTTTTTTTTSTTGTPWKVDEVVDQAGG